MNIQINKNVSGYSFVLGNFNSTNSYFLIPGIKSVYKYAWQAEKDARTILKSHKYVLSEETDAYESISFENASAEQMMLDHYINALKSIKQRASGIEESDEDARKFIYEEIKMVVQGLLKIKEQVEEESDKGKIASIINDFSALTKDKFNDLLSADSKGDGEEAPVAASTSRAKIVKAAVEGMPLEISNEEMGELMEEYACRVCEAVQGRLEDAVYVLHPKSRNIDIVSSGSKKKYIRVSINKNYLVSGLYPYSDLPRFSSLEFYQLYFKPICNAIGHMLIPERDFLIVSDKSILPDAKLNPEEISVEGWDIKNRKHSCVGLNLGSKNRTWRIAQSQLGNQVGNSKYTEQDYIGSNGPAIVECIDSQLESIVGKKGVVVQCIPMSDHVEVDVDFGNHIVRLTESQIKILHEV